MKKILFVISIVCIGYTLQAQEEFKTQLTAARSAYKDGKLDETRFAMEQMLQDIDMVIGKEVLKLFPAKMMDKSADPKQDNVSGASGFIGVIIHRTYGVDSQQVNLEVISNSPLVSSLSAMLSLPFIAGSGDNKVIKIAGYKALLQKSSGNEGKDDYEVQLPLSSSLITFRAPGYSKDDVVKMANTIPVAQIAKMIQ
jgi:hypothetical protein